MTGRTVGYPAHAAMVAVLAGTCNVDLARPRRGMAVRSLRVAKALVLLVIGLLFVGRPAHALLLSPPECVGVFAPGQRVAFVPAHPRTGEVVTLCVDHSPGRDPLDIDIARTGNQIQVTVHDTYCSWSPCPNVAGATLGPLTAGSYLVDVVALDYQQPVPSVIATAVPLDVAGPVPVPTLGSTARLLLAGLLAWYGVAMARSRDKRSA